LPLYCRQRHTRTPEARHIDLERTVMRSPEAPVRYTLNKGASQYQQG
jgi:hypothetical protein